MREGCYKKVHLLLLMLTGNASWQLWRTINTTGGIAEEVVSDIIVRLRRSS